LKIRKDAVSTAEKPARRHAAGEFLALLLALLFLGFVAGGGPAMPVVAAAVTKFAVST
jgi:hypothetical protein